MKPFIVSIFFLAFISCSTKNQYVLPRNEQIIDYNQSYGQLQQMRKFNSFKSSLADNTIFLIGAKEYPFDDFSKALKKINKFNLVVIEGEQEIRKLGYSTEKVQKIVRAEVL